MHQVKIINYSILCLTHPKILMKTLPSNTKLPNNKASPAEKKSVTLVFTVLHNYANRAPAL